MSLSIRDYAEKQTDKIKEKLANSGSLLRFAFIPDLHYKFIDEMRNSVSDIVIGLNKINDIFPIDFVCLGGDNVGNYPGSREEHITMMLELADYFSNLHMPWITVKGNHDDNSIQGRTDAASVLCHAGTEVTDDVQYKVFSLHQLDYRNFIRPYKSDSLYGALDFPEKKLRAVFLCGDEVPHIIEPDGTLRYTGQWDYAYSGEQLRWLYESALDVPEDTGIMLFSHIPFPRGFENDGVPHGEDALDGILGAFVCGGKFALQRPDGDFPCDISCDFNGRKGKILFELCGHIHCDREKREGGVLHISTLCAGRDPGGLGKDALGRSCPKTPFSETETAFDIFCLDKSAAKLDAVRWGVGTDRKFLI